MEVQKFIVFWFYVYQHQEEVMDWIDMARIYRLGSDLNPDYLPADVLEWRDPESGLRYLAKRFGCQVDCLNLSEVQNERNRALTERAGLSDCVHVVHANFESIPGPAERYDAVWSQDAILHSGARERVLAEVARVTKPAGSLVFTDPMQTDDCPGNVLQPVLDRIHLDSLASPAFYRKNLAALGFAEVAFEERVHQLRTHYDRVRHVLEARYDEMVDRCGVDYVKRMLEGLGHWVNGADRGHLTWGIFHFSKSG